MAKYGRVGRLNNLDREIARAELSSTGSAAPDSGWEATRRLVARRRVERAAVARRQLEEQEAEEEAVDPYPYDADWDDHDVDWG